MYSGSYYDSNSFGVTKKQKMMIGGAVLLLIIIIVAVVMSRGDGPGSLGSIVPGAAPPPLPADCNGIEGGTAVDDACGVCGGDGSTCPCLGLTGAALASCECVGSTTNGMSGLCGWGDPTVDPFYDWDTVYMTCISGQGGDWNELVGLSGGDKITAFCAKYGNK